jgi:hypothetical protein
VLAADVMRRVFMAQGAFSYSQTGEDRFIDHLLGGKARGFYVDVGCNHPTRFSNTFVMYKRGWNGIVVDANGDLAAKFKRIQKKDHVVEAVVSSEEKTVTFTEYADSLVSSVDPRHVAHWRDTMRREVK